MNIKYQLQDDWYEIILKFPSYLADKDYEDYVMFNIFRYSDTIDITLKEHPYHKISALFKSRECAEEFCRQNGNFVQNIEREVDRGMITQRIYLTKENYNDSSKTKKA